MNSWLSASQMMEKYDVNADNLHSFTHKNKGRVYVKKEKSRVFYNVALLEEKRKELVKIWNASHEYYYWLKLEAGLNDSQQSRLIIGYIQKGSTSAWGVFLGEGLWRSIHDMSILLVNQKRGYLYDYCKWAEDIIPKVKKLMDRKKWNSVLC